MTIEGEKSEYLKKTLLVSIKNEEKINFYISNLYAFVNDLKKLAQPTYELILDHLNYLNNNDFYVIMIFFNILSDPSY